MTDELYVAQAELQLLRLNFDRLAESSEAQEAEIKRLRGRVESDGETITRMIATQKQFREAGKAALDDMEDGNDADAHLILKHNFGPKP